MGRSTYAVALLVAAFTFGCTEHTSRTPSITGPDAVTPAATSGAAVSGSNASTPNSATVQFGLVDVGSGFPPASGHDRSGHANDTLVPGTVVIDRGGTVTFNVVGIHQIAIYEPGKTPADVATTTVAMPAGCPPLPPFRINDPAGRIAINGSNPTGCGPRTYSHTFDEPGRYLVICEVLPHFEIKMYGWVIVRDR